METSSFSEFDLISHPHQSLDKHLGECDKISALTLQRKYFSAAFYHVEDLETWRRLLVYFHDFGKGTDYFQHKIINATEREKVAGFYETQSGYFEYFKIMRSTGVEAELRLDEHLSNHAKLGAYYLFSQFAHSDPIVQAILLKIIQRHHGYLTNFANNRKGKPMIHLNDESAALLDQQQKRQHFELYNKILIKAGLQPVAVEQWAEIRQLFSRDRKINQWITFLHQQDTYQYFLLQHYLFSLLLSADKGDMQLPRHDGRYTLLRENKIIEAESPGQIERYKLLVFDNEVQKPIDVQREAAFQDIVAQVKQQGHQSFFSITLPTGMGKTFAAYKAAFLLQQQFATQTGTKPRIVYCLPFTSVIDQNAAILADIFEKTNLEPEWISVHHYLSHFKEGYDDEDGNDVSLEYPVAEYLTEGWEQDVIVTTFVQLLESIFSNRNRALRKFHNLTHAVIVLDEVQAIPPKYFNAIEDVFRHLALYFGTKFVFVTATQPLLFAGQKDIVELTDPSRSKTRAYFRQMERINLDQRLLRENDYKEMEEPDIQAAIAADIETNPDKSFLIICNTIKQSQAMFRFVRGLVSDEQTTVRYLSSSIIPFCRQQLIKTVKNDIKAGKRQFLISTQVVEAGVDIDFNIVWRDWAPLDSINQSAGRCNRNGIHGKGIVRLFHSGKAKYIYDTKLLAATCDVLSSKQFDSMIQESDFLTLNEQYAVAVWSSVAAEHDCSRNLKMAMKHLELETVNELFKLIEDTQLSWNVFIPYNQTAREVWKKFMAIFKIEDRFERKKEIKLLRPELLPFVTRFPKNSSYQPPENQKEAFIIYDPSWKMWYDETIGFREPIDGHF